MKTREIPLESERTLTVKGRIDRIDIRSDGQLAVLDYKTQRLEQLKKRLDPPGEDVQLPLYAWLVDGPVANASFLSLEKNGKRLESAGLEDDLPTVCEATLDRLATLFNRLYRGAPLPAHGAAESCGYCEMRGLCRKDYWDEPSAP
ncbi:MAG TPA: hypothetical protein DEP05_09025 [Betaproteobacteria bacterium]|nr:hypothetical protein [Betaproteobacteria bacterium]